MKRVNPRRIHDKFYLSRLLERYLYILEHSPMEITLRALSYDAGIPESVFRRLKDLHNNPQDGQNIDAADYHILFSNIMFRYPTVKIWVQVDGDFFFEM